MLSSGIYEQIVNTRISTELSKLDPEQYDIQLESLDADDARRMLTFYISYQNIARGSWKRLLGREYKLLPGSTGCAIF